MSLKDYPIEKRKFIHSILFPSSFLILLWIIKLYEFIDNTELFRLGIYPRSIYGLKGILFSPVIHGSINHLLDNSISLFLLSCCLFYFYNLVAYRVFFVLYFLPDFLVWCFGRESYHIGASGIIYGLSSFLFFSGIIKKNKNLIAISLLVVFLYGSMVWGIFPFQDEISWESHLFGGVTGLVLSIVYMKEEPVFIEHTWNDENEIEDILVSEESE